MKDENEILAFSKLTSKGQITIPKNVREELKIHEGDLIFFYSDNNKDIKIVNRTKCKIELNKN